MLKPAAGIARLLLSSLKCSGSTTRHHATRAGLPRAAAATSAGASSPDRHVSVADARLHGWVLTLERGIGKAYGSEGALQSTGAFAAEVFPDLPIATTWHNLAKAVSGGLSASASADPAPPFTHYTTRPGALKVITAAANLRSQRDLEARVLAAAGDGAEAAGGQRADVLLCVSGSHPVRTLPLVPRFLRSSLDTLRIAQRLRQLGRIPPSTQLWVVANPNTEPSAALLEAKAALGADAVLTQPPLDWPAYLAWLSDAERRGLLRPAPPPAQAPCTSRATNSEGTAPAEDETAMSGQGYGRPGSLPAASSAVSSTSDAPLRLLVGHPMLSSAANLSFWVSLGGCGGSPAAQRLLAEAARAELGGKEAATAYFEAFNRRLVQQVLVRGSVAGLHVMPITKVSKQMALGMLADGSLPPTTTPT